MRKLEDLREHLFDVIIALKEDKIKVEVAAQIGETARIIIDSARAETEFLSVTTEENSGTGFIPLKEQKKLSGSATTRQ